MAKSADDQESSPPKGRSPANRLNGLTAKEWLSESVSVWTQRGLGAGHAEAAIERQHPAPFSYTDVSRVINMLSKPDATVLDPFVGVGSTLKACALTGRNGVGFELNPHFAALTRERLATEVPPEALASTTQTVWEGDIRILANKLDQDTIDLLVTSPPYWGILNKKPDHKVKSERLSPGLAVNYGDDPRDLANIVDYKEFIEELAVSLGDCAKALKHKGYIVLIVGDFRHKSRYYPFHADIARALEERGLTLQAMNILYQRHKRVFPYGYPYAYVPNVHHQNIVILRKL
ncbi:DNA methyltransferase [Mycobacterium asiaticum]|uniref:DNA methyltransferase n=1 Tax=Mycobacterium asiaticum TaxID=1790 RepID=UPI0007EFF415|nr:DNA methyltransferase [Mycobacterium asiaticum]OBI95029.1 DNA methylase [Mycobacterium asiaticum]